MSKGKRKKIPKRVHVNKYDGEAGQQLHPKRKSEKAIARAKHAEQEPRYTPSTSEYLRDYSSHRLTSGDDDFSSSRKPRYDEPDLSSRQHPSIVPSDKLLRILREDTSRKSATEKPAKNYSDLFKFQQTLDGYVINSLEPTTTTIWRVIKTGDLKEVRTLYGTWASFDTAEEELTKLNLGGLEDEIAAVRALIQKNTAGSSKPQQPIRPLIDLSVDKMRSKFDLSFHGPRSYLVFSRTDNTYIDSVDCVPGEYGPVIDICTRDDKLYASFAEARKENENNLNFLSELGAVEKIIQEKGGEVS